MREAPQYLLAIYIAQQRQDPPIPSGVIAEMLDRSPPTVTEMCQRLGEKGLVLYEPYGGVALTESGHERATRLHETYAIVSWFFRAVLELDDYESEAMELAGLISPEVAKRLADTLPHPESATTLEIDGTDDEYTDDEPT
jgi:DtxR family Mn-dependent transcriptional regulator